jgi:hypothetical protein
MRAAPILVLAVILSAAGCRSRTDQVAHETEALTSLRATAAFVADSWLAGTASARYAGVALARVLQLARAAQAELGRSPDELAAPAEAALSTAAEELAQTVARLAVDVRQGDLAGARRDRQQLDRVTFGGRP